MHITDSDGQITLQTSTPPTHDIQVESKNGAVELTLPPSSNFQIEASSHHGEVECDFSGPGLKVVKEGDTPSISGSFGKGGAMIRINTDYGAIRILRAGSHPAAPPTRGGAARALRQSADDVKPPGISTCRRRAHAGAVRTAMKIADWWAFG